MHALTGVAPTVALHIPWDKVDDYARAGRVRRRSAGVRLGAINSNVFQDDDYKLGSVTNPDPAVRRKALDHLLECVDIMDATGSRDLKLWFADGTNYPGQDDIRGPPGPRSPRRCAATYERLGDDQRMLLEYKLFEPAFYTTDVPDWGTSYAHCLELGEQGPGGRRHRPPRARHQHRVHRGVPAAGAGSSAAFDFNSRFYADDDLMVGAADPFQLFRIMHEIVLGGGAATGPGVAFMLDQCHNIEPKIPAIIRSVMNVQEATAKALLVDADALAAAQRAGDVLAANAVADGRLQHRRAAAAGRASRDDLGLDPDPIAAYHRSGYDERIGAERVGGAAGRLGRLTFWCHEVETIQVSRREGAMK